MDVLEYIKYDFKFNLLVYILGIPLLYFAELYVPLNLLIFFGGAHLVRILIRNRNDV
jgi:hypothetical protein